MVVLSNRYAHVGYVSEGMIATGEKATLSVDTKAEQTHAEITLPLICFRRHCVMYSAHM